MHLLEPIPDINVPIWLDCDPGNDDAFAILLASFCPYFHLLGISTVHGNVLLEKTSRNAAALLDVLGFRQNEIPVFSGSEHPLQIKAVHAEDVHGESGIGGVTLPKNPRINVNKTGYLEAMKEAIEQYEGQICIVCTGTLTNFAKLIKKYPLVISKIRYVSIMGGAIQTGNITPYTEFNLHCDPHAASIVFLTPQLANKIILCPLNFTHTVLATEEVRLSIYEEKSNKNSPIRNLFYKILTFYFNAYKEKYNNYIGPPVHDPLAVFSVLAMVALNTPRLAKFADAFDFHYLQRKLHIDLGEHSGETIIENGNLDPLYKEDGGVYIALSLNSQFYWAHIFNALDLAEEQVAKRTSC